MKNIKLFVIAFIIGGGLLSGFIASSHTIQTLTSDTIQTFINNVNHSISELGTSTISLTGGDLGGTTSTPTVIDFTLTSEATGTVAYFDGSNWVVLSIGTAGQVLEVNSGATAPEWDTDDGAVGGSDTQIQLNLGGSVGASANLTFNTTTSLFALTGSSTISNSLNVDSGTLFVDAPNNRVGIGITNPLFPLSLDGALGNRLAIRDNGGNDQYGFGIQASLLQMFTNTSGDDIAFGHGLSDSFTENVRFEGTGNVGIGDATPDFGLEIFASSSNGWFGITSSTDGDLFVVDENGNIGIGTSTPSQLLVVGNNNQFTINSTGDVVMATSTVTRIIISGDEILDFAGTGLTVTGNALTADLGTAIDAGEITAAAIDGDDINSNIAGRSITLTAASPDTLDADVELYTDLKTLWFEDPVAADDFETIWVAPIALTITKIHCESDQTVVFDLEIDDGSPAGVNGSDITCTTFATDSSLGGDTSMAAGDRLDLALTSVSGTPTFVSISFEFTYND